MPPIKTHPLQDRLKLCAELGDECDRLILKQPPRLERAGSGERMMLAIWGRAQTTYGAVIQLATAGDGDSVAMLSRPLFESAIDGYWIAKHSLKAQELAVNHLRLLRIDVAEHY